MKLTRLDVYKLVWSHPATWVARQLGVSSASLGKTCARAGVPTPPRGHWQRSKVARARPWAPLPEGNAELAMPWSRVPAIDEALARIDAAAAKGRPADGASQQGAQYGSIDVVVDGRQEDACPPRHLLNGELARRFQERLAFEALCGLVSEASRHQPTQIAEVMSAWVRQARREQRLRDPVLDIVSACIAIARQELVVPWWTHPGV